MIYFTGDTHGELDRFKSSAAKNSKKAITLWFAGISALSGTVLPRNKKQ